VNPVVRRVLLALAFFAALLLAWEAVVRLDLVRSVLMPTPSAVFQYLVDSARDGSLAEATLVTARRLGIGYAIGLVAGLPLGLLLSRSRFFADTLGVLALGFQTLPSVCWAPFALLGFGPSETGMLFIVVMGTVWSIALATWHGVRSVPPIYTRAARTMGSRRLHTTVHVVLPASLPFVVSGMKQGWAFAWRSLMAAEIYITVIRASGLGLLLHNGREVHAMDQVIGVMFVIVVVGLVADRALFSPFERMLHRRWGTGAA
jgi:NitT/TauT family transport system permease protein